MSISHYKAKLKKKENNEVFYNFNPDFIDFGSLTGEFKINLETWEPEVTKFVEIPEISLFFEGRDSIYLNRRATFALSYKIKKHFDESGEILEDVLFIS